MEGVHPPPPSSFDFLGAPRSRLLTRIKFTSTGELRQRPQDYGLPLAISSKGFT